MVAAGRAFGPDRAAPGIWFGYDDYKIDASKKDWRKMPHVPQRSEREKRNDVRIRPASITLRPRLQSL